VPSITANEIAKAYADIHSRSRSTGHAFRRVIKAFWTYLGDATRADETGVTIDLSKLKKDPRVEIGDPNTPFDPEEEQGDAPAEIELGRLLAISRVRACLIRGSPMASSFSLRARNAIARKRQIMSAWCAWLDKWAESAIEEDPRLLDDDWLCESIYRNRYGEDRLQRRITLRKKQGTPLWGVDLDQKRPARKRGA
jgi:hypothetical protein